MHAPSMTVGATPAKNFVGRPPRAAARKPSMTRACYVPVLRAVEDVYEAPVAAIDQAAKKGRSDSG